MKIILLTQDAYYEKLNNPYNPPDSFTSKEVFDEEYYHLYDKVKSLLGGIGENDAYGNGDFYLEASIVDSRGLGFEVMNDSIITEKLLDQLQRLLKENAPGWQLYLASGQYEYGIFIGSESIWLHRRSDGVLPQLTDLISDQT